VGEEKLLRLQAKLPRMRQVLLSFDATALTSLLVPMPSLTVILSFWPMALRDGQCDFNRGFAGWRTGQSNPRQSKSAQTSGVKSYAYENIQVENCS